MIYESKIQAAADRLGVPREWQVQRSIAEIWAMHRQRSGEALNVFMRARIHKIDIEGDARRTVQNRRHSTDEDEINLCPDQRRNDLPRDQQPSRFRLSFLPARRSSSTICNARKCFCARCSKVSLRFSRSNVRSTSRM